MNIRKQESHSRRHRLLEFSFFFGLLLLLIVDPFIERDHYFLFEANYFSFAAYGFVSCVTLILGAKFLRKFIQKEDNYYDEN